MTPMTTKEFFDGAISGRLRQIAYPQIRGWSGPGSICRLDVPELFKLLFVVAELPRESVAGVVAVGSTVNQKWCVVETPLGKFDPNKVRRYCKPKDIDFVVVMSTPKHLEMEVESPVWEYDYDYEYVGASIKFNRVHLLGVSGPDSVKDGWESGHLLFGDVAEVARITGVTPLTGVRWRRGFSWFDGVKGLFLRTRTAVVPTVPYPYRLQEDKEDKEE